MVRAGLKGNFEKAREIHYRLTEITSLLFAEGSPSGIKALLQLMGICEDFLRLPLAGVSKSHLNKLAVAAEKVASGE
jgi:4-hydroxy-tetrahydrodipicolinate synthase